MYASENSVGIGLTKVQAVLTLDSSKAETEHCLIHYLVPDPTGLWWTIQSLLYLPDAVFLTFSFKTFRLLHVNFLTQFDSTSQEGGLDVNLVKNLVVDSSDMCDCVESFHLHGWRSHFIVVNAIDGRIPLDDKTSLPSYSTADHSGYMFIACVLTILLHILSLQNNSWCPHILTGRYSI